MRPESPLIPRRAGEYWGGVRPGYTAPKWTALPLPRGIGGSERTNTRHRTASDSERPVARGAYGPLASARGSVPAAAVIHFHVAPVRPRYTTQEWTPARRMGKTA